MNYRKTSWLMAGITTLALGLTALPAQAAEATPVVPATVALTPEALGKLLTDMGLEPKKISDTTFEVVVNRGGWKVYFRVFFSQDRTRVWLMSSLENIPDISKVPAGVLAKLLEGSFTHSPSFFYLYNPGDPKNPSYRELKIARPVDNRNITAQVLRQEIDTLFDTIKTTKPLWMASEWKTGPTIGPAKGQGN